MELKINCAYSLQLPPFANRPGDVEKCVKKSLEDLQLDYIDLYLMHVPFTVTLGENNGDTKSMAMDHSTDHLATWKVGTIETIRTLCLNFIGLYW